LLFLNALKYILFDILIAPEKMKIKKYEISNVDLGNGPIKSQSLKIKREIPNRKKLAVKALNKETNSLVLTYVQEKAYKPKELKVGKQKNKARIIISCNVPDKYSSGKVPSNLNKNAKTKEKTMIIASKNKNTNLLLFNKLTIIGYFW